MLRTCFMRVSLEKDLDLVGMKLETGVLYVGFKGKMELLWGKCQEINRKLKKKAFFELKLLITEFRFDEYKEKSVRSQFEEFSRQKNLKQAEIFAFQQENEQKSLFLKNLRGMIQIQEKTIAEKEKIIEDLRITKSKTSKINNFFQKIEGIESQLQSIENYNKELKKKHHNYGSNINNFIEKMNVLIENQQSSCSFDGKQEKARNKIQKEHLKEEQLQNKDNSMGLQFSRYKKEIICKN